MFIVKNQLTVSRTFAWKQRWLIHSIENRKMLPNSIAKQVKQNKLGNNQTVAQGSSSGGSNDWGSVPALQTQGSIKTNKKGKRKEQQPPKPVEALHQKSVYQQVPIVTNPFYKLYELQKYVTTNNAQQRQLSNVSFNRNAKAGGNSRRKSAGLGNKFIDTVGTFKRRWQNVADRKSTDPASKPGLDFSLMNYNVLSQELLDNHPEIYKDHKKSTLPWTYRWDRLMIEIKHHNSDIICLQEVQETHLNDYYIKYMTNLGYEGIYKKRTGDCPDGCAIFYKWDVFKLIEYTNVEFRQPNTELLDRDNVGLIAKFAPLRNISAEFVVATTHLLYNPRRDDVRVAQIQLFLAEIDRVAYKKSRISEFGYVPIILTGDFNSLPTSFPVNFINLASVNYNTLPRKRSHGNYPEWIPPQLGVTDNCQHLELLMNRLLNTTLSREDELKVINIHHSNRTNTPVNRNSFSTNFFRTGYLQHGFIFKSVYQHSFAGETEATTYQNRWITVDYIFYSTKKNNSTKQDDKLLLMSRYLLPSSGQLNGLKIPNRNLGSDHLALLAKFRLAF